MPGVDDQDRLKASAILSPPLVHRQALLNCMRGPWNAAAKVGKLGTTIQSIVADLKPEVVYFTADNGQRTAFLFLEMENASQIPAIAEPWFLAFNATIEIHPVMVPDDLAKAGSAIEAAANKYR
jgi:hypothetical protein